MIWSLRKSVGFSHTSTPFDSVSTVTPISGISRRDLHGARRRRLRQQLAAGDLVPPRRHRRRRAGRAAPSRSAGSVTGASPAFSGADASTTRLSSVMNSRAERRQPPRR